MATNSPYALVPKTVCCLLSTGHFVGEWQPCVPLGAVNFGNVWEDLHIKADKPRFDGIHAASEMHLPEIHKA